MKQVIPIIVFGLLLIACGQDKKATKWPDVEIKAFKESCFENAKRGIGEEKAVEYCDCMLGKMMKIYPDIKDAEKITMGETMQLAKECTK